MISGPLTGLSRNGPQVPHVGWVCCWFSPWLEGFSPGSLFFLLPPAYTPNSNSTRIEDLQENEQFPKKDPLARSKNCWKTTTKKIEQVLSSVQVLCLTSTKKVHAQPGREKKLYLSLSPTLPSSPSPPLSVCGFCVNFSSWRLIYDSAHTERKRINPPKLRLTMLKIDILNEHLSVLLRRLQSMKITVQSLKSVFPRINCRNFGSTCAYWPSINYKLEDRDTLQRA